MKTDLPTYDACTSKVGAGEPSLSVSFLFCPFFLCLQAPGVLVRPSGPLSELAPDPAMRFVMLETCQGVEWETNYLRNC